MVSPIVTHDETQIRCFRPRICILKPTNVFYSVVYTSHKSKFTSVKYIGQMDVPPKIIYFRSCSDELTVAIEEIHYRNQLLFPRERNFSKKLHSLTGHP